MLLQVKVGYQCCIYFQEHLQSFLLLLQRPLCERILHRDGDKFGGPLEKLKIIFV